jgi:hypothetical protein
MIRAFLTMTGVLVLLIAAVDSQIVGVGRLRAGAHRVDITPNASDLQTSTDSIRDRLYARAIVVDDGSTCAVFVGIDLGAAPNPIVDANKTIVVTLANGFGNSGYIYSDAAYSHLTFQVIGSRLKPGCAEGKIVSTALDLMRRSHQGAAEPDAKTDGAR